MDNSPAKRRRKASKPANELNVLRRRIKLLEGAENKRKRAEEASLEADKQYRSLFENMIEGFAYCRMLYENGKPVDFIYLNVNSAFEKLTGLKNVVGKKVSEVIPGIRKSSPEMFEISGGVALTGEPQRFETYVEPLKIWLSISVYSPQKEHFVAVFDNIGSRKQAEESLALLAHAIRSISECISVTDTENKILFVNDAFSRTYGYTPDELIGKSISVVRSPQTEPTTDEVLYSTCQGGWQGEMVNRKKDGTEFPVSLSTSIIRNHEGHVLALVGIAMDITERKQAEEEVRKSHRELRALTGHLHQSIEEERTRIAREIHDEIGQLLTATKMGLIALKRTLSEPRGIEKTNLVEEIQSITAILDTGTAAIRRIIRDLRPEVLDTMGLSESIEWLAREFQHRTGIRTVVQLPRKGASVNQPRATALFRVCQEALTNVIRHSNATEVKINLSVKGHSVALEMIDNGKGVTIEELNSPTALGILSIRERIASFSGKTEISGKPGEGTIVHVEMPME